MNGTANSNDVSIEEECDMSWMSTTSIQVVRTAVLSVIMFVTLLGNVLVVTIFYKFTSVRSNTNYFIVNMAASDLLFPIILWPTELVDTWTGYNRRWFIGGPVGDFTCKLTAFLADASSSVSIQSLILITVERFVAVVYPMKITKLASKTRTRLIMATWVVAAVINSPYFYIFRLVESDNKNYCVPSWEPAFDSEIANRIYFPMVCVLLFIGPVIIIASLYTQIALVLKLATIPGVLLSQESTRRQKQSQNILKMSLAVVLAFVLCWLPQRMYVFLRFSYHYCELARYNFFALLLAYTNSALNPCFSEKYRHGLSVVLSCCVCVKKPNRANSTSAATNTSIELKTKRRTRNALSRKKMKHYQSGSRSESSEHTDRVFLFSSLRRSTRKGVRGEMC